MTASKPLRFSAFSATHIGLKRSENQDAFGEAATRYGYAYVVCDGMGGHAGGAEAAHIAVEGILDYLKNELQDSPVQALHEAIRSANSRIFERAAAQPELRGMGSTCVVLLIANEGVAYLAHVGDSRIYGMQNGELFHLTKDHSFVQLMVDQGQMTEAEAEQHPNRNQILRALGADEEVRPTIAASPIPLAENMRFLLCTDGLNGMVGDADIAARMSQQEFNETLAEMLVSQALNGGGKDNVTVTIVEIEAAPKAAEELKNFDVRVTTSTSGNAGDQPKRVGGDSTENPKPKRRLLRYIVLLLLLPVLIAGLYMGLRTSDGAEEGPITPPDSLETQEQPTPQIESNATNAPSDSLMRIVTKPAMAAESVALSDSVDTATSVSTPE